MNVRLEFLEVFFVNSELWKLSHQTIIMKCIRACCWLQKKYNTLKKKHNAIKGIESQNSIYKIKKYLSKILALKNTLSTC